MSAAIEFWRTELIWDNWDGQVHARQTIHEGPRAETDARNDFTDLARHIRMPHVRRYLLKLEKTVGWTQRAGRIVPSRDWSDVETLGDWTIRARLDEHQEQLALNAGEPPALPAGAA